MKETVKDIMTKEIVSVLPSDTLEETAKLMANKDIGSVPVVSGGALKGLVTDRDIVIRGIAKGKSIKDTKVSELMTTDVAYLTPDNSVHDAISMMAAERVRRLPVVKGGVVDGIVSLADIARIHAGPEVAEAISEISRWD